MELTKVMGSTVRDIRPSQQNMLYTFNSHSDLKIQISHALSTPYDTLFSAEELVENEAASPERIAELTVLRRRQLVFTSMADAMTDEIGQWLNRIKSAGTDQLKNIIAVLRTHVESLGTHRCTMGDAHDELSELHETFIDSQVEVLPISITRTNSIRV